MKKIIGIGTDITDNRRIMKLSGDSGSIGKFFTDREIKECEALAKPHIHLSGKFAGKEAVIKALGISWENGLFYNEIEILSTHDSRPEVLFHGSTKKILDELDEIGIMLTLSHVEDYSVAFAVAWRE